MIRSLGAGLLGSDLGSGKAVHPMIGAARGLGMSPNSSWICCAALSKLSVFSWAAVSWPVKKGSSWPASCERQVRHAGVFVYFRGNVRLALG